MTTAVQTTVILADSSLRTDHIQAPHELLAALLARHEVVTHPFVIRAGVNGASCQSKQLESGDRRENATGATAASSFPSACY